MGDGVALEPGGTREFFDPGRALARVTLPTRGGKAMGDPGVSTDSLYPESLTAGSHVEVRNRFTGAWSRGFEVVEIADGGYKIRRLSDGSILPTVFPPEDVRHRAPKKAGLWWYR